MQVILDSSFARPGSAPIWGGKKVEFRDWTKKDFAAFLVRTETSVSDICRLQTADCRLQTADCRLQTADCRLQTADYRLQTADYRLHTAYSGPQNVDYKRRSPTAGRKS